MLLEEVYGAGRSSMLRSRWLKCSITPTEKALKKPVNHRRRAELGFIGRGACTRSSKTASLRIFVLTPSR